MKTVNVPVIRSDEDLAAALGRMAQIVMAQDGPEADEAEVLATLIQAYEREHDTPPPFDPVEAIKFAIEQQGKSFTDLARVLGSSPRASEIMNRRRRLTVQQIRAISKEFALPIECLIGDVELMSESAPLGRKKALPPELVIHKKGDLFEMVLQGKKASMATFTVKEVVALMSGQREQLRGSDLVVNFREDDDEFRIRSKSSGQKLTVKSNRLEELTGFKRSDAGAAMGAPRARASGLRTAKPKHAEEKKKSK